MSDEFFGLVLSFPDDSSSFVNGFEVGALWTRMKSGHESDIEETTHVENREVFQRMATTLGWSLTITPSEVEGWDFVHFVKDKKAPASPNPHGLRVVE